MTGVKAKQIKRNGKIKGTIKFPGWYLRFKGKQDAKKGKGVCEENIVRWYKEEASLEVNEVIAAENTLQKPRESGAVIITRILSNRNILSNATSLAGENPINIRESRRTTAEKSASRNYLKIAAEELSTINETIINVDAILVERIKKTRDKMQAKLRHYIAGAISGGLHNCSDLAQGYDDTAFNLYKEKHQDLDNTLGIIIKQIFAEVAEKGE